uniref:FCP1 homology domain-containing protein n=1 Tax=Zea mays TaxID=4577 RepID=A0A804P7X9_MAIZE
MDPPPATRAASRRRDRRRRLRQRQRAAAATKTKVGAAVLAVEPQSAAVTTPVASIGPAATPASRGRKRRRPRRRRGRNAGAAGVSDEPPAASPVPVPDAPQASCNLEAMASRLSDNVLQTMTEKIMRSDKTSKRNFQHGNEALKDSVAEGAACSSLARREHSTRENGASRSKILKRSNVKSPVDSCTEQGTDMDYHKMKSADLLGNLEEVYQERTCLGYCSSQKLEEYWENENVSSLNSSSLQAGKKRKKRRGRKKHNRRKKANLQDSPASTAADNSGLVTFSENCTSALKLEEQRKKQDQNKTSMTNLLLINNAKRSEPFDVNLEGAIEKSCELAKNSFDNTLENRYELAKNSFDNTLENRYELAKSNSDYINMVRNGLQEQDLACLSNSHNVNYLKPSHLAEEYTEKLKHVFSLGKSLRPPKKKLLILDLNGLLVDINEDYHNAHMADAKVRRKLVFRRPYCDDFLNFCALNFELGIWSSRKKENVDSVVNIVMSEFKPHLLFCWDMSKCTFTGHKTLENKHKPLVLKELRKLWNVEEQDLPWEVGDYSPSNTLLVDDSPYKALRNPPHTAIFPHSYSYLNWNDDSLAYSCFMFQIPHKQVPMETFVCICRT